MFLFEILLSAAPFRAWAGAGNAGGYNAPGVPNITGWFGNLAAQNVNMPDGGYAGAFKSNLEGLFGGYGVVDEKTLFDGFSFDASRSNVIYGASSTVMPASVNLPTILYLGIHA